MLEKDEDGTAKEVVDGAAKGKGEAKRGELKLGLDRLDCGNVGDD